MNVTRWILLLLSVALLSCEQSMDPSATPIDFQNNPDAQAAALRLTDGGTTLPTAAALNNEINGFGLTERLHSAPCEMCGVEITAGAVTEGAEFSAPGAYNIRNDADRIALVARIRAEGRDRHATTTLDLPGGRFEVFNDALTLPDGTYVNLTYQESRDIAREWGCRLPNYNQAEAIRRYAEQQNARLTARPHNPDNGIHSNMTTMMNDSEMRRRSELGRTRLINGHFKWYIDDGSDSFRFYGFYAPGACSEYCQDRGSSGGHGRDYIDYSQSARLICPAR
ncbi:MAG: hypothetical protein K9K67_13280 [Bacteriovoracaceae bacterium]|nr:hypothetical protein [Bacteriovoracaceae bacterium]